MNDKTKTITAKQSARRGQHFWDAFNGLTVKINHQRFPDGIFELTYRKRQACFSDEPKPEIVVTNQGNKAKGNDV